MKNTISFGALVSVSIMIFGCRMNTTRIGIKYDEGLILRGAMNPWDAIGTSPEERHVQFNEILMDPNCGESIKRLPDIYIGLPNGDKYYLPELDAKTLESISSKIDLNDGRWLCNSWHKSFNLGSNPDCYNRGYWQIIVDNNGNFCQVRSGPYKYDSKKGYRPVIWDSQLKKKYIFPLTWNEAIELFGKPTYIGESLVL